MSDTTEAFQFNPPAPEDEVKALMLAAPRILPQDYLEFLLAHNGGEGAVGGEYIILWGAADVVQYNKDYEVEKYAPGLFIFGSTGGGEAYAFDLRVPAMPIVQVPFVGMDLEYVQVVAESFDELF